MNNSIRSYPRTLNEAFPKTAAYGCAIEKPRTRTADWAVNICLVAAVVVVILAVVFQGAP